MKKIIDLLKESEIEDAISHDYCPIKLNRKNRVNVLALGDVGLMVLIGFKLLGGDVISSIGICDLNKSNESRLEIELNQINYPFETESMPYIESVSESDLFDCDILVFCASKGVPPVGEGGDMRMVQLQANREIVKYYGNLAKRVDYKGMIAVVSDPVDPLCKAFLESSQLDVGQIQGYGLGVMNTRAVYYAKKDSMFSEYPTKGRAFGPHGQDLVIADNMENYNDEISRKLTEKVVTANMRVRDFGYKPYIAPALSSAAISIILTMKGKWHYGSVYLGNQKKGAFFGIKNKMTEKGIVYEDIPMDEKLFERIKQSYENLCNIK